MDLKNKQMWKSIGITLSIVVSVVILLFGDNISERFTGPNLIMESSILKFEVQSPNNERESTEITRESSDYLRIIKIKNIGNRRSNNVVIRLNVEGEVYQYKSISTELIKNESLEGSELTIQMDRLSSGANIEFAILFKKGSSSFEANYVDDVKNIDLNKTDINDNTLTNLVKFIAFIVLILTVLKAILDGVLDIRLKLAKTQEQFSNEFLDLLNEFQKLREKQLEDENSPTNDYKNSKNDIADEIKKIIEISKHLDK